MIETYRPEKATRWVQTYLNQLVEKIRTEGKLPYRELASFDHMTYEVLAELVVDNWVKKDDGTYMIAISEMMRHLGVTRKVIVKRLKILARCEFFDVKIRKRADGFYYPAEFRFAADFLERFQARLPVSKCGDLIRKQAGLYLTSFDRPWKELREGVSTTGSDAAAETEPLEVPMAPSRMVKLILDESKPMPPTKTSIEIEKKRAQMERRRRADQFVAISAEVWVKQQASNGFGSERPSWEGEHSRLVGEPREHHNALKFVFEKFGGTKAAMAWAMFCGAVPMIDSKAKRIYNPDEAHRQYVGRDHTPKAFLKYLDSVMKDPVLIDWLQDEQKLRVVRSTYGLLFDEPAHPEYYGTTTKPKKEVTNVRSEVAPAVSTPWYAPAQQTDWAKRAANDTDV